LCSDGLWDEVGDELIAMVLSGRKEPEEAASELVRWAKEAGGRDNITVIVLDVVDGGEAERGLRASAGLGEEGEERTARSRPASAAAAAADEDNTGNRPAGTSGAVGRSEDRSGRPGERSLMQAAASGAAATARRPRLVTWRVVAFVIVLLGVLAAAAVVVTRGGPAWAVTLDGSVVVVKEGDVIRQRTPLELNQLPADIRTELVRGKRVDDKAAAQTYIDEITRHAMAEGTLHPPGAGVVETTSSVASPPATSATDPSVSTPASTVPGP